MKHRMHMLVWLPALALLAGCTHYTARQGKTVIVQEAEATTVTRLSDLDPAAADLDPDQQTIARQKQLIARQDEQLTRQQASISALQQQLAALQQQASQLEDANSTITTQSAQLAEQDRSIQELEDRLAVLAGASDQLEDANSTIITQNARLSEQTSSIATLQEQIATLQNQLAALEGENTQLEAVNADQAKNLSMNQETITSLSGKVAGLQARVDVEDEKQRQAAEAEAAKAKALVTLDPLDTIVYPKTYRTGNTATSARGKALTVVLLPLGDTVWPDDQMAEILGSVADLDAQVILATGSKENTYNAVRLAGRSAVLTEQGAVISDLEVSGSPKTESVVLKLDGQRSLTFALADLPQTDLFETMAQGGNWKALEDQHAADRKTALTAMLDGLGPDTTAILGASLYEPATSDWEGITPYPWRDASMVWPLASQIESYGFGDTYRQTHYSVESDPGNTLGIDGITERCDYLFGRHVVPLSCEVVAIGPASAPSREQTRYGLEATFIIP